MESDELLGKNEMEDRMNKTIFVILLAGLLCNVLPVVAGGGTWTIYGPENFTVTDGTRTEKGSDLFTDLTYGDLSVTVLETNHDICVLQHGITTVYPAGSTTSITGIGPGDEFRVIDKYYWFSLPPADGAYNLCWERHTTYLPLITK